MPNYEVTVQGQVYDVEAPSHEEALKGVQKWRQDQLNQKFTESANQAPEWAKPLMAIQDATMGGLDTITAGMLPAAIDRLTGTDEATMATEASKNRMGWAGTGLTGALAARAIPSAVVPAVKYMGGGKALKNVIGGTIAGAEGAAYGGIDAATHDQDPRAGTVVGGAGGVLGHGLGGLYNQAAKWWKGADDIPAATKVFPGQKPNPTRVDKIEGEINQARAVASTPKSGPTTLQDQYIDRFRNLATKEAKSFTPEQQRLMTKIYQGDPAISASRGIGDILGNKLAATGVGAAGGFAMNPLAGLVLGGGMLAGSKAASALSRAGTEEAVQNLRRTMFRQPKFIGPISDAEKARLAKMATVGLLNFND
jgi:hypothetical protein